MSTGTEAKQVSLVGAESLLSKKQGQDLRDEARGPQEGDWRKRAKLCPCSEARAGAMEKGRLEGRGVKLSSTVVTTLRFLWSPSLF